MTLQSDRSNTNKLPNLPEIYQQITRLSQDSLIELATFLEYLRFKSELNLEQQVPIKPIRAIQLRGIVKEQDFSPKLLKQTRLELWHKFQNPAQ